MSVRSMACLTGACAAYNLVHALRSTRYDKNGTAALVVSEPAGSATKVEFVGPHTQVGVAEKRNAVRVPSSSKFKEQRARMGLQKGRNEAHGRSRSVLKANLPSHYHKPMPAVIRSLRS